MVPSLTCRRSGQRDAQFAKQAFQTVASTPSIPSAAEAGEVDGMPKLVVVATSAAEPPATPDHFMNERRETLWSSTGEVILAPYKKDVDDFSI